jgi:NitT/TauT family transport system ATP-binding protein
MHGIEKVYAGRNPVTALTGVELSVADGEFVALLGPSGCGKSTLLNIVAGFEQPTGGRLSINGGPPRKPGPDRAVVFQESALFPWLTVRDNVTFGPRIQRRKRGSFEQEAQRTIELVGLKGFESHYPDQLSGGMKQRVGIARCLLMQPQLFLMDEPFGALDAQTRLQMQELLLHVWETLKRTVIFITHDIDEAILLADTVYVMSARPGRIKSRNPVTLPRPRTLELLMDPTFNALRRDIMHQIREEAGPTAAGH